MLGHDVGLLDKAIQVLGRREGIGVYLPKSSNESVYYWFGVPHRHR